MIVLMAMVTFAVDIGYVSMVRSELQRTADATALAAAGHLYDKDALRGAPNYSEEIALARTEADNYASSNDVAKTEMYLPAGTSGDFVIGNLESVAYPVEVTPSTISPNAVKVMLRRDDVANGPIALFFGPLLGRPTQEVTAQSIAYYETGIKGFKGTENTPNPSILPYTMLYSDWDAIMANPSLGSDIFKYDSVNRIVSYGSDNIPEMKLFPLASSSGKKGGGITPGNFGTLDIGSSNNSTNDLARQILEGQNAYDMSFFPNNTLELGPDGTVTLNGDTGVSAGVKDELAAIKGQPRVLPLYSTVNGNGNNANFVIVRFVGVTIVDVKLTGSLSSKYVMIQPTYVVDPTAVSGGTDGTTSRFVRRPLSLIE
jgi:Flp pilus assembly protein TadG